MNCTLSLHSACAGPAAAMASRLHGSRHQGALLGLQQPAGLVPRTRSLNRGRLTQLRVAAAASSPPLPAKLSGDDLKEAELKKLRTVRAAAAYLASPAPVDSSQGRGSEDGCEGGLGLPCGRPAAGGGVGDGGAHYHTARGRVPAAARRRSDARPHSGAHSLFCPTLHPAPPAHPRPQLAAASLTGCPASCRARLPPLAPCRPFPTCSAPPHLSPVPAAGGGL